MDLFTHGLAAAVAGSIATRYGLSRGIVIICGLIPDLGEFFIQQELSFKYGNTLGVYDERTSDPLIAADQGVTWLYDLLHSLFLPVLLCFAGLMIYKGRHFFLSITVGLFTHVFLDSFTHGKVWALKLFYPLSNHRVVIMDEVVGNWWDWTPAIQIFKMRLPLICMLIWLVLLVVYKTLKTTHFTNREQMS